MRAPDTCSARSCCRTARAAFSQHWRWRHPPHKMSATATSDACQSERPACAVFILVFRLSL
eukprot:scaffold23723_cov124-Isochrysis_galbana.AAC.2